MISPFTISLAQALMLPSRPVHSKAFFPLGVLALCLFHTLYEPVGAFLCLPVNVGKVGVELLVRRLVYVTLRYCFR